MPNYRKRPVVIEAHEYTVENCRSIHEWMGFDHADHDLDCEAGIFIDTMEGRMEASLGDFIIKSVQGEFYPCKPDIFAATYELVALPPTAVTGRKAPDDGLG